MRVLIVDDCADSVAVFSRLLALCGYEVEAARTGEEALKLASVFQPDVVFLDLWMPAMDGYEVAKRMRQLEGLGGVRIIALSGIIPNRERDREAGIDAHLIKPVNLDRTLLAIEQAQESDALRS